MGTELAALVVLAGCDGVLHLERVPDPRDATGSDGAIDAPIVQSCTPGPFTMNEQLGAMNLTVSAPAQNIDVALVGDAGGIKLLQPIASASPMAISIPAGTYSYLALQPTLTMGSYLFFQSPTTALAYESMYLGPTYDKWMSPIQSDGLPGAAGVFTPAELTGGGLRMVVMANGGFAEYERSAGSSTWAAMPALTIAVTDLGFTDGELTYPALTPDGFGLVFVYGVGSKAGGIYFTQRSSLTAKFGAAALVRAGMYFSPVLKRDCSAIYAVDASGFLIRIH